MDTREVGLRLDGLPNKKLADQHYTSNDGLYLEVPTSSVLKSSEVNWAKLNKDGKYVEQFGNNPGALDDKNLRAQVLGSVTITKTKDGGAGIFWDKYDFEMHAPTSLTEVGRDIGTVLFSPGKGTPYDIRFDGHVYPPKDGQ